MVKRKRTKTLVGCPRCGGMWTKVAGILRCERCGHASGDQQPSVTVKQGTWGGRVDHGIRDDVPERHHAKFPRGRRDAPLNIKE